jgi:hypothetical protein
MRKVRGDSPRLCIHRAGGQAAAASGPCVPSGPAFQRHARTTAGTHRAPAGHDDRRDIRNGNLTYPLIKRSLHTSCTLPGLAATRPPPAGPRPGSSQRLQPKRRRCSSLPSRQDGDQAMNATDAARRLHESNPVAGDAFAAAAGDSIGRATFEYIMASPPRPEPGPGRAGARLSRRRRSAGAGSQVHFYDRDPGLTGMDAVRPAAVGTMVLRPRAPARLSSVDPDR